ncbi:spore germination protein [Alkaliphilus hydrothermalis]|uniref:Spore germination protein KA n=1 Tax=Alkaliphilus hydrothermalis TaxID=1482730 RepID=A0ABS2NSM0_9FIRM|nr:spore germination protein [Alkaliphilus hydrothermalis]MBM7615767.1 spore germination protein KA [Alkaliphilus hydrothermalis]
MDSKYKGTLLEKKLENNLLQLKEVFKDSYDIIYRELRLNYHGKIVNLVLVFNSNLVDAQTINENIIKPIIHFNPVKERTIIKQLHLDILKDVIPINGIAQVRDYDKIINAIFSGNSLMIVNGIDEGLLLNTKEWPERSVEEPDAESVVRGSREGFTESISTNTGLIRRKLKDPALKAQQLQAGSRSKTNINVLYMEDIVNKQLLDEVLSALQDIEIDGVFESGYVEQLLEDHPYSPFPQFQITERPDKVCGNLLEGKIALIIDGAPQVLILPTTFFQLFQSPEDYYERTIYGSLTRWIRYLGFFIATSFPAIYVALISFHQQMLPTDLILDLSKTRAQIPFPPVIEALLMELTIELLREASARLPKTIGQIIGIVGAIVIGDAAVSANLVSPVMVIIVAITALGSYVLPQYSTTFPLRFLRFPMILLAASFGAFGIIITWSWIIVHLCSLSSFGYPYLSPLAPISSELTRDAAIRKPLWGFRKRPQSANKKNYNRW